MDTTQTLAARLQHDARTPLNSILGMVELLEATPLNGEQREYVNVLRRSTESLLRVVDILPEGGLPAKDSAGGSLAGMRILLVDDAEDNRFLTIRYLKNSGAAIDEATDGVEAVRMVQQNAYNVVLMDVEMPVMDGFAATQTIRQWESAVSRAPVRIIALTAHDPREVQAESRAAGCDGLLTKPVRKSTLLEALAPSTDVADLVPGYLAKRRNDVGVLRKALESRDFEAIRALAHKLAGSGAGYGFPKISTVGAAMERAARASEAATVAGLIDALEDAVRL